MSSSCQLLVRKKPEGLDITVRLIALQCGQMGHVSRRHTPQLEGRGAMNATVGKRKQSQPPSLNKPQPTSAVAKQEVCRCVKADIGGKLDCRSCHDINTTQKSLAIEQTTHTSGYTGHGSFQAGGVQTAAQESGVHETEGGATPMQGQSGLHAGSEAMPINNWEAAHLGISARHANDIPQAHTAPSSIRSGMQPFAVVAATASPTITDDNPAGSYEED